MTEPVPDLDHRARAAAAELLRAVTIRPPDRRELVQASRIRRAGQVALAVALLAVLGAVAFGAASVAASTGVRWATGAILLALVASTFVLCAHAGGHAWFVPAPALVLAILWAVLASGASSAAWWLAALCAAMAAAGVVVGSTALRMRLRTDTLPVATAAGRDGRAVTALTPFGVVKVGGETWTAESLSGPLDAGTVVHVVRARGVRLEVWSEAGTVPDRPIMGYQDTKYQGMEFQDNEEEL
jgi:membrane protein implicated in regulation of membrane protease activity